MIVLLAPALAALPVTASATATVAAPAAAPAAASTAAPAAASAQGAPAPSQPRAAPQPAFKPINHDEDYSSFRAVRDANLWTRLKYIPLGDSSHATLGGEFRARAELRLRERFGRGAQDNDGNLQQRTRLWGDIDIGGTLRAFVDLEHATSHDLDSVVAPIEQGRLDFNQAFLELRVPVGQARITARVGRQEVGIGNQTVFDMREGANTRRSLDLVRVMGKAGPWDGGVMAGYAVSERQGTFDDGPNRDFELVGAHVGRTFGAGQHTGRAEALFVASDRASVAFDSAAAARDRRRTLSLRYAGKAANWSIDVEGIGQWGRFGDLDIGAWYATGTVAHAWQQGWKPKLGLRLDAGSGDRDRNDGKIGTYAPLFPRPLTYNGDLGPQNLIVVQPMLTIQPVRKLTVDLTAAGLWRTTTEDGVYSLGGQIVRRAGESARRLFGTRATLAVRYAVNPFTTLGFYVNTTQLAEQVPPSRDLRYAASYLTFRF